MLLEAQNRRKMAHFIAACGTAYRCIPMDLNVGGEGCNTSSLTSSLINLYLNPFCQGEGKVTNKHGFIVLPKYQSTAKVAVFYMYAI